MSMRLPDEFIQELIDQREKLAKAHAKAKAKAISLEQRVKITRARLERDFEFNHGQTSFQKQERDALASEEYESVVKQYADAAEAEILTYEALVASKMTFEAWRTISADHRAASNG